MVSVLALYSDDSSSNAEADSFSVKFVFKKNWNKQKRGLIWPIFLKKRKVRSILLTLIAKK